MEMKYKARFIGLTIALLPSLLASGQSIIKDRLAIKVTADIGLGKALGVDATLPEIKTKSSSFDFGFDVGWTFWKQNNQSLEANLGFSYGSMPLKAELSELEYNYSAPASADMDNEPYIRYYRLSDLQQKFSISRVTIPIYLNYRYQFTDLISAHALLGIKLGFLTSSKLTDTKGEASSYGVYPQYDNLMIDASYMNEFGNTVLTTARTLEAEGGSGASSFMIGAGAEVFIWGPLSADLSFRYESGFGDVFKKTTWTSTSFNEENAPVNYSVEGGQKIKPLSNYFTKSKISRLSCCISLIYRF